MVCNDAAIDISEGARKALIRGLAFVPAAPVAASGLLAGLERLRRNINLRLYWSTRGGTGHRNSLVSRIIKSTWQPPEALQTTNPAWKELQETLTATIGDRQVPKNLPKNCLAEWRKLSKDPRIFIVKADKGGKTVIWKRTDYNLEAERMLGDEQLYKELSKEEASEEYDGLWGVKRDIIRSLRQEGCITASEERRLEAEEVAIPPFYILPKIHKGKRADTGTFPGRPITAAVGGMMKSLDSYLADTTAPLLRLIPGSLIDTAALLRDMEGLRDLPAGCRLASADVEALYPSIPWEEGLDSATAFYAEKLPDLHQRAIKEDLLPPPSPGIFRRILEVVLKKNIFHLQDRRWFIQRKGTAMGCSMSVLFANTFMYGRTRHLLENPPRKLKYLGRYIDDFIIVWEGEDDEIPGLFAQTVDGSIKLTYVYGGNFLEALDLVLELQADGTVATRLFRKPTDGHQYVHWSSAHPEQLKTSIPYAQLLRIKRNCSRESDYHREAVTLLDRFRTRGYPEPVLTSARRKADARDRAELLLTGDGRKGDGRLTLVTDNLNGADGEFKKALRKFHGELEPSLRTGATGDAADWPLPAEPPRLATRAGRSLGGGLGPAFKKGPTGRVDLLQAERR